MRLDLLRRSVGEIAKMTLHPRRPRDRLAGAVAISLLLCLSCWAAPATLSKQSPSPQPRQGEAQLTQTSIKVADGRLSVNLRQADLREVLSRIGKTSGFSLRMASTAGESISVQFTDMTVIQGVRRLLRLASVSYAMVYEAKVDSGDGLKELWVFTAGPGSGADLPTVEAEQQEDDRAPPEPSPLAALAEQQRRDGQSYKPGASPQEIAFLKAVSGERSKEPPPPAPVGFLEALDGQPSAAPPPPPPAAFLEALGGQPAAQEASPPTPPPLTAEHPLSAPTSGQQQP